jgi:ribose-phosphate pyrophosphokinase
VLARHFRGHDLQDAVVVSPDFGNAKSATASTSSYNIPSGTEVALLELG